MRIRKPYIPWKKNIPWKKYIPWKNTFHGKIHSDDELIERIRCGDEDAAEELIKRYYTLILRYCKWHRADTQKAEDLTQETFF